MSLVGERVRLLFKLSFPISPKENLKKNFDNFKWLNDENSFQRWTKGETGIPIVDAGMRELYQTGYMHNRSTDDCRIILSKKSFNSLEER